MIVNIFKDLIIALVVSENKMTNLREILANNLKEYRRKCGISQAKLAEKAEISTQYIAMIELSRQFPTPEVLDRIAAALGIEAYQLFAVSPSPEEAMERLHDTLVGNLERIVGEAVKKAIAENNQDKPSMG
ncbi:MAG: helix-turn-helix transcriptional regulator [Treponema sp.]|jgi:transcriptional regulator with XRE-family HTH domain|nr:helix-turn-helix transcriptional regulator [Treponema sp.]